MVKFNAIDAQAELLDRMLAGTRCILKVVDPEGKVAYVANGMHVVGAYAILFDESGPAAWREAGSNSSTLQDFLSIHQNFVEGEWKIEEVAL